MRASEQTNESLRILEKRTATLTLLTFQVSHSKCKVSNTAPSFISLTTADAHCLPLSNDLRRGHHYL